MEIQQHPPISFRSQDALDTLLKKVSQATISSVEDIITFTVDFLFSASGSQNILIRKTTAGQPSYTLFSNAIKEFITEEEFNSFIDIPHKQLSYELPGKTIYDIFLVNCNKNNFDNHEDNIDRGFKLCFATIERCELLRRYRHETNQFMKMAEYLPQMVWTTDEKGKMLYTNKKCEVITGLPKYELIKNEWREVMHPDDYLKFAKEWLPAVCKKGLYEGEVRMRNFFGYQYRWFNIKITPLSSEDAQNNIFLGCANDIHTLKSSQQHKENMLKIASHELRGPITTIKAYLQLLQKAHKPSGTSTDFLTKAAHYTDKLNTLVSELLESAETFQEIQYQFQEIECHHFIGECINTFSQSNPTHKLIVRGDLQGIRFTADKEKIEQVVVNLLNNAVKYSPDANKIVISLNREFDHIRIMITDFGIGIPDDFISQVFLPEKRSNQVRSKFPGLGLGLYLCAEIVKAHNGKIGVNSREGMGSTFYFTLPILKIN